MTIIAGYDIETTGTLIENNKKEHRIIEAALVYYELETGKKVGEYLQRFNPQRSIEAGAYLVHHIALGDLVHEPSFKEGAEEFRKAIEKADIIVAHNGDDFDFPFTILETDRVGCSLTKNFATFDTMKQGRWATVDGKVPRLGELCYALDVDYDEEQAHGALYDVEVMMECFFKGQKLGFFKLEE